MIEALSTSQELDAELRALFAKAKIPSSPALAAQILELAQDPDSTVDQFADLIRTDPGLTGRLLNMCNSAASAQRTTVTTVQRAVALLGINRVRTVSLGFQLVSHLDRLGRCSFDMKTFWKQSLLRGCLAREFAERVVPALADEAFLVGLLQDCGILLLVQVLGRDYAELCRIGKLSPTAFFGAEQRRFRHNHVEAIVTMARTWKLPEVIVRPLAAQHTAIELSDAAGDLDRLSAVSYLVGSLRLSDDLVQSAAEPSLERFAADQLELDADALRQCLERSAESYAETARLLGDAVPEDLDVTDLLSQANAHLTSSVEAERDRAVQEQAHLKSALGEYRDRAARDPLTDVLNRGALTETAQQLLREAQRSNDWLSVLFLDLDDFKRLNDTFGHHAGDEVLRGVARTLEGCVTNAGVVGRYGGEEFLLVVPGLAPDEARHLAEQVVTRVRETRFPGSELCEPVTCSVGLMWAAPDPDATIDGLVADADELMYEAKRLGKDRCRVRVLRGSDQAATLQMGAAAVVACATEISQVGSGRQRSKEIPRSYRRIAKRLNRMTPAHCVDMRKQTRKALVVPCVLTEFCGSTLELVGEVAYVRNISIGGIGLLAGRPIPRGEPVEVAITMGERPTLYIAGLVAFCRHVEGTVYEVGVQLFTHSSVPILSEDPISAVRSLDWVAAALRSSPAAHDCEPGDDETESL